MIRIRLTLHEADPPRGVAATEDVRIAFAGWLELMHVLSSIAARDVLNDVRDTGTSS